MYIVAPPCRPSGSAPGTRYVQVAAQAAKRLHQEPLRIGPEPVASSGGGGCRHGLCCGAGVDDLHLAGLGLFGHRDGDGEHAVRVGGGDVVAVQALPEEQTIGEVLDLLVDTNGRR